MDYGADKNVVDNEGNNLLHIAALQHNSSFMSWLSANVFQASVQEKMEAQNTDGITPLLAVRMDDNKEGMECLSKYGLDQYVYLSFHVAARQGKNNIIQWFLMQSDFDKENINEYGYTPLQEAVIHGNIETIKILLDGGANKNVLAQGDSLLYLAVRYNQLETIRLLLTHGFTLEDKNGLGQTPLLFSVEKSDPATINFLLSLDADINAVDALDNSILHAAVTSNNLDFVTWLIEEKGFDLNVENGLKQSPLFFAVESENQEIISYLLSKKASLAGITFSDESLLHVAASKGLNDLIKVLLNRQKCSFLIKCTFPSL